MGTKKKARRIAKKKVSYSSRPESNLSINLTGSDGAADVVAKKSSRKRAATERLSRDVADIDVSDKESDEQLEFEDSEADDYESEVPLEDDSESESPALKPKLDNVSQVRFEIPDEQKKSNAKQQPAQDVYRHGIDQLAEGEELVHDESAYEMLHQLRAEWPALSFDCVPSIRHALDNSESIVPMAANAPLSYPLSVTLVAGTQATKSHMNRLFVMQLSQLFRTRKKAKQVDERGDSDDSESSENSDDDEDQEMNTSRADRSLKKQCLVEHMSVKHEGTVNRVRLMPQNTAIAATWSSEKKVFVTDLTPCYRALSRSHTGKHRMPAAAEITPSQVKPLWTLTKHADEGYALDWNTLDAGSCATGDCAGGILKWRLRPDGSGVLDTSAGENASLFGVSDFTHSVEDIQWSPTEPTVFASCSTDSCIRFWDTRQKSNVNAALTLYETHKSDVNVISWNTIDTHLLLSGGDDGALSVWDLRAAKTSGSNQGSRPRAVPAARFDYHKQPITAVSWHPVEASMLVASSEDNSVTVWDLAVERDPEEERRLAGGPSGAIMSGVLDIPPQLLFVHLGQIHIKEVRWHPVYTSVLTTSSEDGFNCFRVADIF